MMKCVVQSAKRIPFDDLDMALFAVKYSKINEEDYLNFERQVAEDIKQGKTKNSPLLADQINIIDMMKTRKEHQEIQQMKFDLFNENYKYNMTRNDATPIITRYHRLIEASTFSKDVVKLVSSYIH